MKKITSVVALLMAMLMLASCGGAGAPAVNPEDEVRATVTSFMDAIIAVDTETAKSYTSDEQAISEFEKALNLDGIKSSFDTAGGMLPSDKLTGFIEDVMKKIFSTVKYEIGEIEIDGDKAEAAISLTYPDFEAIDMSNSNADYTAIMQEAFGFDLEDVSTFMQKYAEKKGITSDDLIALFSNGDQSALMNDLFETFEPEFKKMFDLMSDEVIKLTESKTATDDGTVELEKDEDGVWKITNLD